MTSQLPENPVGRIATREEVARILHVGLHEIDNVLSRLPRYYRIRKIPKTNGKFRVLMIPQGKLRILQDKVQKHIFKQLIWADYVQGGVKGKSCITNALQHTRKDSVLPIDIQDYYPSIRPERVNEVFEFLGFEGQAAHLLTRITTYNYQLPQGPPTSPAIANLAIRRIDARFRGLVRQQNFTHTRFVDDITVSGGKRLSKFQNLTKRIVQESGFQLKNESQISVQRRDKKQTVTRLGVNWRLNPPRAKREQILGSVAQCIKNGEAMPPSLQGQFSWLTSVNPNIGKRLKKASKAQQQKRNWNATRSN